MTIGIMSQLRRRFGRLDSGSKTMRQSRSTDFNSEYPFSVRLDLVRELGGLGRMFARLGMSPERLTTSAAVESRLFLSIRPSPAERSMAKTP